MMITILVAMVAVVSSYYTFEEGKLTFGYNARQRVFEKDKLGRSKLGQKTRHELHSEALKIYENVDIATWNYDKFWQRADKAYASARTKETRKWPAYKDEHGNYQFPGLLVKKFKWTKHELFALMEYSGSGTAARNIKKYWQTPQDDSNPPQRIPILASLLYSATHKDYRKKYFFKKGFTSYFGFTNIDLPIIVNGQNKFLGDTLEGATLHGPWSTSTDEDLATKFTTCKDPDSKHHIFDMWITDPTKKWPKNGVSIIFKVIVAPNSENVATFGIAPLSELSMRKKQKEYLTFDLDGKYVTIYKVCYNLLTDPPQKGLQKIVTEAMRDVIYNFCVSPDFCDGGMHCICPVKVIFHGEGSVFFCQEEEGYLGHMYCKCKHGKHGVFNIKYFNGLINRKSILELDTITKIELQFSKRESEKITNTHSFQKKFASPAGDVYELSNDKILEEFNSIYPPEYWKTYTREYMRTHMAKTIDVSDKYDLYDEEDDNIDYFVYFVLFLVDIIIWILLLCLGGIICLGAILVVVFDLRLMKIIDEQ